MTSAALLCTITSLIRTVMCLQTLQGSTSASEHANPESGLSYTIVVQNTYGSKQSRAIFS